jgi:hypothetical protein
MNCCKQFNCKAEQDGQRQSNLFRLKTFNIPSTWSELGRPTEVQESDSLRLSPVRISAFSGHEESRMAVMSMLRHCYIYWPSAPCSTVGVVCRVVL